MFVYTLLGATNDFRTEAFHKKGQNTHFVAFTQTHLKSCVSRGRLKEEPMSKEKCIYLLSSWQKW